MKKIREITEELIKLGEDPAELEFWEAIFDHCAPEEQKKILTNFEKELTDLRKLNQQ